MILGDVRHKAAWVKEVDIMLRLQHPGDHLHQNRQLSLLVIVSMTYDVNCPELLKTLNNSRWFSTFPLRRRLMSAHSRGSWPRHQVPYKMMNYRPKHQFLENQHFLDMLELCVHCASISCCQNQEKSRCNNVIACNSYPTPIIAIWNAMIQNHCAVTKLVQFSAF